MFDVKRLKPVTVITGHYGVGKTNLAINLALDARYAGMEVRVADLDIVNPYFRSSDYRRLLEDAGVQVIAPRYAGTTLDAPAISGQVSAALDWARGKRGRLLLVDAGGDDAGATALGRFASGIADGDYDLLYVVNRSRNLTHDPAEALCVLREIEAACHGGCEQHAPGRLHRRGSAQQRRFVRAGGCRAGRFAPRVFRGALSHARRCRYPRCALSCFGACEKALGVRARSAPVDSDRAMPLFRERLRGSVR